MIRLHAVVEGRRDIAGFATPEHINDGEDTAPSKRIIRAIPEYEGRKPTAGPGVAAHTGLQTLRQACPHFHAWLSRLESLDVS